ncbi:putative laccase [Helianthus annuus]|nr:putative laccase [Helianthus annuus]
MLAFIGQRGTLWWHAHVLWLRVTVHGAIVNLPKLGVPYLFPKRNKEVVLVLGEWWKSDTKAVINQAQKLGQAPNVSDAYTINGNPGPIANCLANGINPCKTCVNGNRVVADINNITFVMPKTALLQAHYFNISGGFTDDFPSKPLMPYNYTGIQPKNFATNKGNFNPNKDPKTFNLVVPVERNTVGVPTGGWTAIRFKADNPVHTTWGLKMAFVVDNGKGPLESVILPPSDLLKC